MNRKYVSLFLLGLLFSGLIDPTQAAEKLFSAPITAVAFSVDGQYLLLGSQSGIVIRHWPLMPSDDGMPYRSELEHIHDLQFSPDGTTLAIAGGSPGQGGRIEFCDWLNRETTQRIVVASDVVYRIAWSQDAVQLAAAAANGLCMIVDAQSHKVTATYPGHSRPVLAIAFLPDEKTIVSAGVDQTVRTWIVASGTHLRTMENHLDAINGIAHLSSDDESSQPPLPMIATWGEDMTVRVWQPTIGRLMRFIQLPSVPRAAVWSPLHQLLFVACNDTTVRTIDPVTMTVIGEQKSKLTRIHEIICSPRFDQLIVAGEGGIETMLIAGRDQH